MRPLSPALLFASLLLASPAHALPPGDTPGYGGIPEQAVEEFRMVVSQCWHVQADEEGKLPPAVRLRIVMNRDGTPNTISVPPEDKPEYDKSEAYRQAFEHAAQAVRRCSPLKLPPEHYEVWKDLELIFDPVEILSVDVPPSGNPPMVIQ